MAGRGGLARAGPQATSGADVGVGTGVDRSDLAEAPRGSPEARARRPPERPIDFRVYRGWDAGRRADPPSPTRWRDSERTFDWTKVARSGGIGSTPACWHGAACTAGRKLVPLGAGARDASNEKAPGRVRAGRSQYRASIGTLPHSVRARSTTKCGAIAACGAARNMTRADLLRLARREDGTLKQGIAQGEDRMSWGARNHGPGRCLGLASNAMAARGSMRPKPDGDSATRSTFVRGAGRRNADGRRDAVVIDACSAQ